MPETLAQLAHIADLVVVADVVASRPDDSIVATTWGAPPVTTVRTAYTVTVVESLKPADFSAREVTVERLGGVRDRGAYVDDYEEGFPRFELNRRYLRLEKSQD